MPSPDAGKFHEPVHRNREGIATAQFHRVHYRRTLPRRLITIVRQRRKYRQLPLSLQPDGGGVAVGETRAYAAQHRIIKTAPEIPRRVVVEVAIVTPIHAVHVELVPTLVDAPWPWSARAIAGASCSRILEHYGRCPHRHNRGHSNCSLSKGDRFCSRLPEHEYSGSHSTNNLLLYGPDPPAWRQNPLLKRLPAPSNPWYNWQ